MKKNILVFGCIIICLILVTISYQPIIAEEPIEQITEQVIEYRESKNDCGCDDINIQWNFPIICSVLGVFWLITMILCVSMNQRQFCDMAVSISDMMTNLNCGK